MATDPKSPDDTPKRKGGRAPSAGRKKLEAKAAQSAPVEPKPPVVADVMYYIKSDGSIVDLQGNPVPQPPEPEDAARKKGIPRTGRWPARQQKFESAQAGHSWAKSDEWMPVFLESMAEWNSITEACRAARITHKTYSRRKESDPAFAEALTVSSLAFRDKVVSELCRRSIDGVMRYSLTKSGERIAMGKTYSDIGIIFLLKQLDPSFRDKQPDQRDSTGAEAIRLLATCLEAVGSPRLALEAPAVPDAVVIDVTGGDAPGAEGVPPREGD